MKRFFIAIAFLIIAPTLAYAYTSPGKPTAFVNDFANVINVSDKQSIENKLIELGKSGIAEISIATIKSLDKEPIEKYAVELFEEWGIGNKNKDNGFLILVVIDDKEVRFEVGYGLEGAVTDVQSANIINKVMVPAFRAGDYSSGIKNAVDAVVAIINDSPEAEKYSTPIVSSASSKNQTDFGYIIFFAFFFLNILARLLGKTKSWWLGGAIGAGAGIVIGFIWGFLYYGLGSILILGILGLIFDYFVSKNPPRSGGRGGGIFPIIFGGGGRGGGFGGFGGGMSGGGGASGRW